MQTPPDDDAPPYPREAILSHQEDHEDTYLAAQTLERLRRGDEATHSLDDVDNYLEF